MAEIAKLRAQRAEVEALLAFRHAPAERKAPAWWRLHAARQARLALVAAGERLPALPAPPEGALSGWQKLRLRLGLLRIEQAAPPKGLESRPREA